MDPAEARPVWCYLEVDEPAPPARRARRPQTPEPADPVDMTALLELVDPVDLDDLQPARVDWAAIRRHADRVGFPLDAHPVDELSVHRRRRADRGTRPRRRRRYAKGA